MSHYVHVENEHGDLEDMIPYCSDSCARTDPAYAGWNGCNENEHREYCQSCGVVIGGLDVPCDCCRPIVVNLIGEPREERCEHGSLVRAYIA